MNTLLVATFVLLIAVAACSKNTAECSPGYFLNDNYERPTCIDCYIGSYCPGDDKRYLCPPGTVAYEQTSTSCSKCPSGRRNSDRTICLEVDTPEDVRETDGVFELDLKRPYWYQTIRFGEVMLSQYTFMTKGNLQVAVYASTKTGRPSKNNYEYMGVGQNVTLPMIYRNTQIVYFYAIPIGIEEAKVRTNLFPYITHIYHLKETVTVIPDTGRDLDVLAENQALFVAKDIPASSIVTFRASVERVTYPPGFVLLYTSLNNVEFPTPYNSNVRAVSLNGTAEITIRKKDAGPLHVGLFIPAPYAYSDHLRITVELEIVRSR